MDEVLAYLAKWDDSPEAAKRLPHLIEAYQLIRQHESLKGWRFTPGRPTGHKPDKNPMTCSFAATPFLGNDWFLLRMVKGNSSQLAIGFSLDFGVQENKQLDKLLKPVTNRRLIMRKALREFEVNNPGFLGGIPYPNIPEKGTIHACKGFETKFTLPPTASETAAKFVTTVLAWEKLYRILL